MSGPGRPIVSVTPAAAAQIRESARQSGIESPRLRIAARLTDKREIEYGMGFDEAGEGDLEFASEGVTLLVAPAASELLDGARLDYVELNPGEHRFIFINPNDPSHKAPRPGK
jgi:iron-sulfur cluster assembly protein